MHAFLFQVHVLLALTSRSSQFPYNFEQSCQGIITYFSRYRTELCDEQNSYQQSRGDFLVTEQRSGVQFRVEGCFFLATSDNILFSARLSLQESFQISGNYSAAAP